MAYVRAKRQGERVYYQLVESYRDGGKVRQRVIAHLGPWPEIDQAIDGLRDRAAAWREHAERTRRRIGATDEQRQAHHERMKGKKLQIPHWMDRPRPGKGEHGITRWQTLDLAISYERQADEAEGQARRLEAVRSEHVGDLHYHGAVEERAEVKRPTLCTRGDNRYMFGKRWYRVEEAL